MEVGGGVDRGKNEASRTPKTCRMRRQHGKLTPRPFSMGGILSSEICVICHFYLEVATNTRKLNATFLLLPDNGLVVKLLRIIVLP